MEMPNRLSAAQPKRKLVPVLPSARLFRALLIASTILLSGCESTTNWENDDPFKVAHGFTFALANHQPHRARNLVISDLQPRVESWLANHVQYNCPFTLGFNYEMGGGGSGGKEAGIMYYSGWFTCGRYRLKVDDFKILPVENVWLITEWGQVCEVRNGKKDCDPSEE